MALLAIICDGYIDWASLPNAGEFFEQEYLFYAMCAKVTLGEFTPSLMNIGYWDLILLRSQNSFTPASGSWPYFQSFKYTVPGFYHVQTCSTISALVSYITVVMMLCRPAHGNIATSVIGLLMAYSARFCYLAAALWAPQTLDNGDGKIKEKEESVNGGSEFMWYLVYGLFFLATIRVIQVTQNRPVLVSTVVAVIAHAVFNAVHHVDWILYTASC